MNKGAPIKEKGKHNVLLLAVTKIDVSKVKIWNHPSKTE
jgi:hypothetical protein